MIPPQETPLPPPPPPAPRPETPGLQRMEMDEEKNLAMHTRTSRRNRVIAVAFAIGLCLFLLFSVHPFSTSVQRGGSPVPVQDALDRPITSGSDRVEIQKQLVPLEAHIMSKCPDARDCLRDMILPTMMRVYDKVNFTLSFIGTPTENDGVECRHGPAECMGNILELCAAKLYPDPKTNLGFTMCITRRYKDIPDRNLIEDCALEHAIDIKKLNDCAAQDDGAYGMKLLRESVRRTANAGVTLSCTVRLDGKNYCIRDSHEWVDCPAGPDVSDLVIAIEKLWRSS